MSSAQDPLTEWRRVTEHLINEGRESWPSWFDPSQATPSPTQPFQKAWDLLGGRYREAVTAAVSAGGPEPLCSAFDDLTSDLERLLEGFDELQGRAGELLKQFGKVQSSSPLDPALGPWQAQQRTVREIVDATTRLAEAWRGYGQLLTRCCLEGLEECRRRLSAHRSPQPLSSKQLYDVWLDSSEASYERLMASEEYAYALAEFSNSVVAVVACSQRLRDDALTELQLPTARDIKSMETRLHGLQRQQQAMAAELEQAQALRREVEALRAELASLRRVDE